MINFAKVIDGNITQTYKSSKQYVDSNGVRFPVSIWQNTEYLRTQSLYKIQEGTIPNRTFYNVGGSTLSYDAVADTVTRSYSSTAQSTETLKNHFKNINLTTFKNILESTNYHIIRNQEDSSYTVPSAVSTWRTTIYTEFDAHVTSIDACSSISDFEALDISFTDQPDDVQ